MAAPSRILSLNLGTQTIGLAEFRASAGGGLTLHSFRQAEILGDPAAEGSRLAQTRLTVAEMVSAMGIKTSPVNYAIPGQSVFTRFVKLPPVDESQVEQIIQFEAQQNVPFPINEVVWDYQLVATEGEDKRVEVVLLAIKADLLDEYNSAVQNSGLKTEVVDVAPMTLYNAFRYNYSELSGCSLIIDIGARTTNLIFVEGPRVFSRSIPIGGINISSSISKDMSIGFAEAEELKKKQGFVSLGGSYAEPEDPEVAKAAKIIRNSLTRLHSEIGRSISFYRAQQQGGQPVRAYLCGGTCSLPYMREFFHEKLQLPIEFLNPLRNVSVTSNVNVEEVVKKVHTLGELVGLALRSTTECPMELNLRPASVERSAELGQRRPYLILAGLCLLLALVGWFLYLLRAAEVERQVLTRVKQKVQQLRGIESQFKQVNREVSELEKSAAPLLMAVDDRAFWVKLLEELNSKLPPDFIWVTSFQGTQDRKPISVGALDTLTDRQPEESSGKSREKPAGPAVDGLRISGLYIFNEPLQANVVNEFVRNLATSPMFANVDDKVIIKRVTPTTTEWAYEYELQVPLAKPFQLQ